MVDTLPGAERDNLFAPGVKRTVFDMRERGGTGLNQMGGVVWEEQLRDLQGMKAVLAFDEMADNDATVGATLSLMDKLVRSLVFRVDPASSSDEDRAVADFVTGCLFEDMDAPFAEFVSEAFYGMWVQGHALFEVLYKQRGGDNPDDPVFDSIYDDGRVGWRAFSVRPQNTLQSWRFTPNGRCYAVVQNAPPLYRNVEIPLEKCLLFRTRVVKGSPLGVSVLRPAWPSYYIKRNLQAVEALGIERDIAGMPIITLPQETMALAEAGDAGAQAAVSRARDLVTSIRRDAEEGIVLPASYDDKGNKEVTLELLTSGGTRQLDISKVIERYDQRIAMVLGGQFLLLGAQETGSFALSKDQSSLLLQTLNAYCHSFVGVMNGAIKKLLKMNTLPFSAYPTMSFDGLDRVDTGVMIDAIQKLSQCGMQIFPDPETEAYLRNELGLPIAAQEEDTDHPVASTEDLGEVTALHDAPMRESAIGEPLEQTAHLDLGRRV